MKHHGNLNGVAVYYMDSGYNAGTWKYPDTPKMIKDRRIEYNIALEELADDYTDDWLKLNRAAWKEAFAAVPERKVKFEDVRNIVTPRMHSGEEALARATHKEL